MEDPLFRRIRRHARRKLQDGHNKDRQELLLRYKEFLRLENEMLLRYHRKGDSGTRVARARAIMIDVLLENLFQFATAIYETEHGPLPCQVCIAALGGYGRAEMCPWSDVDIMFLYPGRTGIGKSPRLKKVISDTVLYMLWDLGLKVGYSTRTIKEAVEEAKKTIETKNSLLEARLVTGSSELFDKFKQTYRNFYRKDSPQKYILARLEDQKVRRARFGDTEFLQEPEIKRGVGGLRDYQNILWLACIKLDITDAKDLVKHNYLRPNEYHLFTKAYDFLLRVRNELHFQSQGPTDVLFLEKQPRVAWHLGYRQKDLFKRVEKFMKDYYSNAKIIHRFSKLLEHRLSLYEEKKISFRDIIGARSDEHRTAIDGFMLMGNTLTFDNPKVFKNDPERLIRVFRHMQQFQAEMDFDMDCLITDSLPLLTQKVIQSSEANKSFRSILQSAGEVYPVLSKMHELGVLGRFVPEWDSLTCLVQHEYYHRYTADIHTLNTLRELDLIFTGDQEETRKYKREIHEMEIPSLLYLILFLHDIGKGHGIKNHAANGVKIAGPILERMQVAPELRERILSIIQDHLEMARFWQHYDVEDPQSIRVFAQKVGDEETLRLLYVLTFCDARSTAASLWNSYKDMLHTRLFQHTMVHLSDREGAALRKRERQAMTSRDIIKKKLSDIPGDEIEAHFNLLPEHYFIHNRADEVALHLRMINQLLRRIFEAESINSLIPVVEWQDDLNLSLTIVRVVTWDRPGLFYKLAGAFSVAGINILSSRAISRTDNIVIDTFYVNEPGGGVVQNLQSREVFQKSLEESLLHDKDLLADIETQAKKYARPSYLRGNELLRAPIPPGVEVYQEPALSRTIIAVQTNDRIGLLYKLGRAIFDHGFDITFARISTEHGVAIDTFHLEEAKESSSSQGVDLAALEETLQKIVGATTRPDLEATPHKGSKV